MSPGPTAHRASSGLAVLIGLAWLLAPVLAQERPWNLPAASEFANRYEGLIALQAANPDFELLSFTGGTERLEPAAPLQVGFYLWEPRPVLIRAQELRDDKYYRMVSKAGAWTAKAWNTFGPWPLADVIAPNQIPLDNIGVVVYLSDAPGQSGAIAPAFLYQRSRQRTGHYRVVFRVLRTTLKEVQYSLRAVGAAAPVFSRTAPGDFIRGTPVFLEVESAALEPGSYVLEITCVPASASATVIRRDFTFEHAR